MSGLIRIASGKFSTENACTLKEVEENPESCVLPLTEPLNEFPETIVEDRFYKDLSNGVKIPTNMSEIDLCRVYCKGEFWGLGRNENGFLKLVYYLR